MDERPVLVVYTGGTLGMRQTARGWEPGADLAGWLHELLGAHEPGVAWELATLEPLIDSSNARPRDWQRIVEVIWEHRDTHRAFVVLHGTDTLGFTASALYFSLAGLAAPIVLTGAQRPFVVHDSDAPGNVLGAVRCATMPGLHQVAVFFDGTLMAAHHATKVSSEDDHAFDTMNLPPLALLDEDGRPAPVGMETTPRPRTLHEPPAPYGEPDLVVLTLHPGLKASRLRAQLTPPPQGVVLRSYGMGNAPDDDPELLEALADASAAGTVVVVTTQCPHGAVHMGTYAVSQGLLSTGAVPGKDFTTDSIIAWLGHLLAEGLTPDQVRDTIRAVTA